MYTWEEDAHQKKENEDNLQGVGEGTGKKQNLRGNTKQAKEKTKVIDKLPGRERR